ncbi:MAG: 30S ribosome-binding factor RbfA [Planctomycetota bacterium]
MPAPSRKQRLESLLRREIAGTINTEMRDPRLGFITITRCELTADLQQVTAYYTVLGDSGQRRLAEHALRSARGFLERRYAPQVKLRRLPRLSFAYDSAEAQRNEMEALIRQARQSDPDSTPEPPASEPQDGSDRPDWL